MTAIVKTDYLQIIKKLLAMVFPLVLANGISAISNFTIMLLMSRLGHNQLAAGALISSTLGMVNMLAIALIMPVGIIVGKHIGSGEQHLVGKIVRHGMILAVIISIPLILFMFFIGSILHAFKQPPELIGLVSAFCRAGLYGMVPSFCSMVIFQFFTGISRPKLVMMFAALSLPLNVTLSYAFLYGKLGAPNLGIAGAGVGMAITGWVLFLIAVIYLYFGRIFQPYRLFNKQLEMQENFITLVFKIGWPICLQYGSELLAYTIISYWMGWLGVNALAAQQISMQWMILSFMVTMAIGQAVSVLVGQAYGRRDIQAAKLNGYIGMIVGLTYAFGVAIVLWTAPHALASVYLDFKHPTSEAIFKIAAQLMAVSAVVQLFDNVRLTAASGLRGFLDTRVPMIISVIGCIIVSLPCAYILAFKFGLGPVGLRWGGSMGIAGSAIAVFWRFYKFYPVGEKKHAS